MKSQKVSLTDIANGRWKEYSMYTIEQRAIPSIVDGLKPSQRFVLYSAIKNASTKWTKIVEIANVVSSYGYHHGETSVQEACTLMAAKWCNNVPFLDGRGMFGNRMVQNAAAPRYIFAKLHDNFSKLFKDEDLLEDHSDEEVCIPKFYLPIIPTVLLNGISGTATGFATNILPYSIKDIINLCKIYIKGKSIETLPLVPSYPDFRGTVVANSKGGYDIIGTYELVSKTKLMITELPINFDREKYITHLDKLCEANTILDYTDLCSNQGFKFEIKLPRNYDSKHIERDFKLKTSDKENLNIIDQFGKIKTYETPHQIIQDFCDYRVGIIGTRIKKILESLTDNKLLNEQKIKFINLVLQNKIVFKNKSKSELTTHLLELKFVEKYVGNLLNMNFYNLTTDEIKKLESKIIEINKEISYYESTTKEKEYLKDLSDLDKMF